MLVNNVIVVADPACYRWLQLTIAHELAHFVNRQERIVPPREGLWYEQQMDITAAFLLPRYLL